MNSSDRSPGSPTRPTRSVTRPSFPSSSSDLAPMGLSIGVATAARSTFFPSVYRWAAPEGTSVVACHLPKDYFTIANLPDDSAARRAVWGSPARR